MHKRLLKTCTAAVILCVAMLGTTVVAMPFAIQPVTRTATADTTSIFEKVRLVCGWIGYFECVRICPDYRRSHRYCQPLVVGLPWI